MSRRVLWSDLCRVTVALVAAAGSLVCGSALALEDVDDATLAQVAGRDGVSFAVHVSVNDPSLPDALTNSRLTMGFTVNGQTNYAVILNPRGVVDMFAVQIDIGSRSDGGGDVLTFGLPGYVRFGQFGFQSLSAQSDPAGPITGDLGRFVIDGRLSMQGQVRMWAN